MRRAIAIAFVALGATLEAGCLSGSLDTKNVSGLYVYDSGDQGTREVCFVLSPDGTYALGNAAAPVSKISFSGSPSIGQWQLTSSGQEQKIQIGNSSLPIKHTSSGVRVVVDADQSMYCDFTKPSQ